jgi:oxalate---CoA ligase
MTTEAAQISTNPLPPGPLRKFPGLHANQLAVRIGGEEGRLFHFFHGDFTTGGLSVPRFAAILSRNRPILAIAPHGIGGERVPASIEEMAADRLPLILEAQPRGPYVLGGHCNGALVAFETARLLIDAGHHVDLVVMIDPGVVSLRRSARLLLLGLDLIERVTGVVPDLRRHSLTLAWLRLVKIDHDFRIGVGQIGRLGVGLRMARSAGFHLWNKSWAQWWPSVVEPWMGPECLAYSRAMSVYHPSRLAVPILYIALGYSGGGWRRISPDIELIDVPVDSHNLSGDFGAAIMDRLRARLDALDASSVSATRSGILQQEAAR